MIDVIAAAVAARKPNISIMSIALQVLYNALSTGTIFYSCLDILEGDISSNLLRPCLNLYGSIPVTTARAK
jgi:hypothetical protein